MSQGNHARTVLVVEDDEDVRDAMRELLEVRNYHVLHLANGRDALVALRAVKVDLIVLDLAMPEMDGWEFLDLRETDHDLLRVPVMVVTAVRDAAVERDDRIQRHLWKPFSRDEFIAAVRELTAP